MARGGVGKSSLLRQIQNMALGDYGPPGKAGLHKDIQDPPRRCQVWTVPELFKESMEKKGVWYH